jgi:hypothetical protein
MEKAMETVCPVSKDGMESVVAFGFEQEPGKRGSI